MCKPIFVKKKKKKSEEKRRGKKKSKIKKKREIDTFLSCSKCASKTIEVVGKPFQVSLLESEKNAFFEPPKQAWSRANIRGITYTSLTYNRLTKRTDSFVCGLPLQRISVLWSSQILLSDSIEGSNDLDLELP